MKIHNVSGTLEEAARTISTMSREERSEFYDEVFKYEPSRPCVIPTNPGIEQAQTLIA